MKSISIFFIKKKKILKGLVGAIFEGVGVSCGSLIGGYMFNSIGGSKTFRIFGVCSLVLFLIHVMVQKCLNKSEKGKFL